MRSNKSLGFTLVELIVVITILAILGTIWFISLQWYATSARDSARISDLWIIAKWLDLFKIQEWYFPAPTDSYNVTFSWTLAWKQWVFWDATRQLTQRISSTPVDPLTWSRYAYSVTNTGQEYELWAITEGLISWNTGIKNWLVPTNTANADNSFFTYIRWNYNKQIVTVKEPTKLYVLWVPTIITTEIESVDVRDIFTRQSFAISWSKNLPWSYANNLPEWQTSTGSVSFTAWTVATAPVLFEGTTQELSWSNSKQILGENLVSYYANSNLSTKSSYSNLWSIGTWQEYEYINTLIKADTSWLWSSNVVVSTQVPTNVGSTLGGEWEWGEWGDSYPGSCLAMTPTNLSNLNNWMEVEVETDRAGNVIATWNPNGNADPWVSSLTISEWCSINWFYYLGSDAGGDITYIPEEFWFLGELTEFDFPFQSINQIPESFTLLENITSFNLSGNTALWDLNGPSFSVLPNSWDINCELWISDTWRGICVELQPDQGSWEKIAFYVSDTDVTSIWSSLSSCSENISSTQLGNLNSWGDTFLAVEPEDVTAYISAFPPSTTYTTDQWCSVTVIDSFWVDGSWIGIIDEISLLLNLNWLSIQDSDLTVIPQSFAEITTLKNINFSWNPSLWSLNNLFDVNSPNTCASVGESWGVICVEWNGTTIDITFSVS